MEGLSSILITGAFSLFVAWRLIVAKEKETKIISSNRVYDEQREVIFTDLEQLEYDYRSGKLDDDLYNSEREKLIKDLVEKEEG